MGMQESPRPEDLDDQRTPVAPEPPDRPSAADPRSEPGLRGTVARLPYWFIVVAVIIFALIALYLVWQPPPAR
jgi:hypothetical protein